ncbi:MAG: CARDB domain-containing protein [Candidatus Nanoarchaeia archaeon]|nr:CARDB domain-containing protein [Candidatus Nanoarchaeia archaeon]
MKMFRKGISPLIATVLIIGFTVALAAIIMTWGTTFSKGMQKTTEATTEEQLACAQDVNIDLSSACIINDAGCTENDDPISTPDCNKIKLTIKNDGSKALESVSARFYIDGSQVSSVSPLKNTAGTDTLTISAYGLETTEVTMPVGSPVEDKAELATLVEIVPVIKVGEKILTCAATKDYYGDQNYDDPLTVCSA